MIIIGLNLGSVTTACGARSAARTTSYSLTTSASGIVPIIASWLVRLGSVVTTISYLTSETTTASSKVMSSCSYRTITTLLLILTNFIFGSASTTISTSALSTSAVSTYVLHASYSFTTFAFFPLITFAITALSYVTATVVTTRFTFIIFATGVL